MAKILLEIDLSNAAFEENPEELQGLLVKFAQNRADELQHEGLRGDDRYRGTIRDTNGNRVGFYTMGEK